MSTARSKPDVRDIEVLAAEEIMQNQKAAAAIAMLLNTTAELLRARLAMRAPASIIAAQQIGIVIAEVRAMQQSSAPDDRLPPGDQS